MMSPMDISPKKDWKGVKTTNTWAQKNALAKTEASPWRKNKIKAAAKNKLVLIEPQSLNETAE